VGFCAIGEIRVISVVFDSNRPDRAAAHVTRNEASPVLRETKTDTTLVWETHRTTDDR